MIVNKGDNVKLRLCSFALICFAFNVFGKAPDGMLAVAKSPDGNKEIRLSSSPELQISVWGYGKERLAPTPIGMCFDRCHIGGRNCKVTNVRDDQDGVLVSFDGDWAIRLVATDEGVAYRFETAFDGRVKVLDETWKLSMPVSASYAYLNYYGAGHKFKDPYQNGRSSVIEKHAPSEIRGDGELLQPPFILRYDDDVMIVASVANIHDYPFVLFAREMQTEQVTIAGTFSRWPLKEYNEGAGMKNENGPRLRFRRVSQYTDYMVETDGNRSYPYHSYQMASSPVGIVGNRLLPYLSQPPQGDFSWVNPGKVAWDWWNDWNGHGIKGCTTKTYEEYIDFAAANGIEYVILDEGWSENLNVWKFNPAVDVLHLIKYGNEKGVGIILWLAWGQAIDDEERVIDHFAKMGAAGFKVDFMDRCDAKEVMFEERFARLCAERKLVVDYHGSTVPSGLQRTYPNILNYEGVHGLEQFKSYRGQNMPLQDVRLVFTRMCLGALDYTPGAMDNYPIGKYKGTHQKPGSIGTRTHQLALMALFEAPLQMLCDSPEQYLANPECLKFMAKVPTVWDETVGLGGDPDSYAMLARRDGQVWYVAAVANENGCETTLDTSFLKEGEWTAEVFRDSEACNEHPTQYVREIVKVKAGDRLSVKMMNGGGYAARFIR